MQAIVVTDDVTHVAGPLIDINRGCSRTGSIVLRNTASDVHTRRAESAATGRQRLA